MIMRWCITSFFFESQRLNTACLFYKLNPKFIFAVMSKTTGFDIVADSKLLQPICKILKLHYNFDFAIDAAVVDYPSLSKRFQLNIALRKNQFSVFQYSTIFSINMKIMCGAQGALNSTTN